MSEIPNLNQIREMADKLTEEYDLEARLKRYQSLSPELIELAKNEGLSDENAASGALFIADFIVTSSEFPTGISDDDRRLSIIKAFILGLKERCTDSSALIKIFYLSQSVAQTIRRNDYFLAGRGLERAASLVILKDIFVAPYLAISKEILGDGESWWELSILKSALTIGYPDKIFTLISETDTKTYLTFSWEMMRDFERVQTVNINDTVSISNIENSKVMLFMKPSKKVNTSLWNIKKSPDKTETKIVDNLLNFMDKSDKDRSIVYMRGNVKESDKSVIMTRDPTSDGKPLVLFHTTADEVNVSELLSLLALKSKENEDWFKITKRERKLIKHITKNESINVEEEYEMPEDYEEEVALSTKKDSSTGFFGKIKNLFRGSGAGKTKKVKKTRMKKEKRTVKKNVKKTKTQETILSHEIPAYVGQALGVLSLGALNMFEIFDIARESEYLIVGTLESDFKNDKTTLLIENRVGDGEEFAINLDGLDQVIEDVISYFTGTKLQILMSEILFRTDDGRSFFVCFDGNEDRLVGTVAITFVKDITKWQTNNEEPMKRRSLLMRTSQLLSSRSHTPFDTSVKRIYGDSIDESYQQINLDKAILSLDN